MKSVYRSLISASTCMLSLAIASSLMPASAQMMQNGSMEPSPMQGGSMQDGSMRNGSMQDGSAPMQSGNRHASLNAFDRQFMTKAAQSDMTEIQTSQLALKRSQDPQVRQFAQKMIQQHTQSTNKLKPIAVKKSFALPTSLGSENQALLTQLTKLSGTQFDQAYMSGQTKAHAKTQMAYQDELKQGKDSDVKAFAREVLPIVTAHLHMAQGMVAGR